jgi:hypothetical protein
VTAPAHYSTRAQYHVHPIVRVVHDHVRLRAKDTCEHCGSRPATRVHYPNGYPLWGTFPTGTGLQAVCVRCARISWVPSWMRGLIRVLH